MDKHIYRISCNDVNIGIVSGQINVSKDLSHVSCSRITFARDLFNIAFKNNYYNANHQKRSLSISLPKDYFGVEKINSLWLVTSNGAYFSDDCVFTDIAEFIVANFEDNASEEIVTVNEADIKCPRCDYPLELYSTSGYIETLIECKRCLKKLSISVKSITQYTIKLDK